MIGDIHRGKTFLLRIYALAPFIDALRRRFMMIYYQYQHTAVKNGER